MNLPIPAEEPIQPTAASVAEQFFKEELRVHHDNSKMRGKQETVVILQDDCYGHRYSRPRTSRLGLSTIVERPERIHASVLGLATAYVRLGGRHAGGHAAPHPKKEPNSLPSPPFRIHKTNRTLPLTSQAATAIHGTKWMKELSTMCEGAEAKLALNGKELTRPSIGEQANGNGNVDKPKLHEGDLYLCSGSLSALEGALGGVCEGVDAVFAENDVKRAFVSIRPPGHHCSADYPSGFCWLNNVHVGVGHAAIAHGLTHAAIIDFDLHHGDGSQSITWAHNARMALLPKNTPTSKKTAIGYFSLHDINSYPCEMGDEEKVRNASLCLENAHGQTIWNVHLQPWKTDAEFWELYENRYSLIITKARNFLRHHADRLRQAPTHPQPRAAIFLSAGFDASEWESPGMQRHQVNVPTDFYARFTRDVVKLSEEEGLGVNGRVVSVLEGGYSDRALISGVLSHISGLTTILNDPGRPRGMSNGLAHEMNQRLGRLDLNGSLVQDTASVGVVETFDPSWWTLPRLEEIEKLVQPAPPVAPPRKVRNATPTYTSATQSYTAKIISPQYRRSLSGSGMNTHTLASPNPRVPSPPPPEVDWTIAAHELSKLLIPSDRQTESCKPEDLNAQATRVRKDRQSTIGLPTELPDSDGKRMQLRDRTSKPPRYMSEDEEEKPQSRANRRKTIADLSVFGQDGQTLPSAVAPVAPEKAAKQRSRRVSVASSIGSVAGEGAIETNLGPLSDNQRGRDALVVKKNRVSSANASDMSKARAVKKIPPAPRIPSVHSSTSKYGNPQASNHTRQKEAQTPLSVNEDSKNEDVEQLASGLKKMSLKLNVKPTQEQKAEVVKPKPAARGRPKSVVPKPTKARDAVKSEIKMSPAATTSAVMPSTELEGTSQAASSTAKFDNMRLHSLPTQPTSPGPSSSAIEIETDTPEQVSTSYQDLPTTSVLITVYEAASHSEPSVEARQPAIPHEAAETQPTAFLPPSAPTIPAPMPTIHQDELQPLHAFMPQSSSIAIIPPTDAPTPSTPKRTKQDLPIFTSSSPIMFAGPKIVPPSINQALNPNPIHEAETKASHGFRSPAQANSGLHDIAQHPPSSLEKRSEHGNSKEYIHPSDSSVKSEATRDFQPQAPAPTLNAQVKVSQPGADIWDIPDTPQQRRV